MPDDRSSQHNNPTTFCPPNDTCKYGRKERRPMTCCDRCETWYHNKCINLKEDMIIPGLWVCTKCEGILQTLEKNLTTLQTAHASLLANHEALKQDHLILSQHLTTLQRRLDDHETKTTQTIPADPSDRLSYIEAQLKEIKDKMNNTTPKEAECNPPQHRPTPQRTASPTAETGTTNTTNQHEIDSNNSTQDALHADEEEMGILTPASRISPQTQLSENSPTVQPHAEEANIPSLPLKPSYSDTLKKPPTNEPPPPSPKTPVHTFRLKLATPRLHNKQRYFLSKLEPSTTSQEIETALKSTLGIDSKSIQLNTRHDTYTTFCLEVDNEHARAVEQASIWPHGIVFRQYKGKPPMLLEQSNAQSPQTG